jgi:hypothetical protein
MTHCTRTGRSLATAIALAITCHTTWAFANPESASAQPPACPAVAEIDSATDIGTVQQMLQTLRPDLLNDESDSDKCDPGTHTTMAMKRAAPLCRVMGVDTSAVFLFYKPTAQAVTSSKSAAMLYFLPYGDETYQSVVAHLQAAGFVRVDSDPYPDLTFRKKSPSWEINDFYRRGEVYVELTRDTDFKKFTAAIGRAATIRVLSRDLNSCR